jgi:hypothetical protein
MSDGGFAPLARAAAAVATGQLGWTPDLFWKSTPRELLTALQGRFGAPTTVTPLGGEELRRLMERAPDA